MKPRARVSATSGGAPTRIPDFIVVGAPKCGTTALHRYLRSHPQIFVPEEKEPNYFCTDLSLRKTKTLGRYLQLFSAAQIADRVGEVSVWYLYSARSARAIRDLCGPIKIIVMLRNPVDAMHSLHSQLVYNGDEHLDDFAEAVAAEPERERGLRVSPESWLEATCLCYRRVYRYAEQIERYWEQHGRENVHFVLFDDFSKSTATAFQEVLRFIGVADELVLDLPVLNSNKKVRFSSLRRVYKRHERDLRRIGQRLVRNREQRRRVLRLFDRVTTRVEPRAPMDVELRRTLTEEMTPGVEILEGLIDRDLSTWKTAQV